MIHTFWVLITSTTNWFYGIMSSWFGFIFYAGGFITYYKHSRCHVDTCHKRGKYPFQHYKLCKNHHPAVPNKITHLHIKQLHKRLQ